MNYKDNNLEVCVFTINSIFVVQKIIVEASHGGEENVKAVLHCQLKIGGGERYNLLCLNYHCFQRVARGFVAPSGKNLICIPAFTDIVIDGEERTAIKLIVEAK